MKELTGEEILALWVQKNNLNGAKDIVDFGRAILKKASEVPQEWQYLTEGDIKEIIGSYEDGIGGYTRELFDKIEAKIREKNE